MFHSVLQTKLLRPKVGRDPVRRPHLLTRLDDGLAGKVILVSAPAGYGKSVLVSDWLNRLDVPEDGDQVPNYRSSWLSLGEEDDHFPVFVGGVVSAIQTSCPECCVDIQQLLQQGPAANMETVTDLFVQNLGRLSQPLVLVLDDLHFITDAAIFAFLDRLVHYAPRQLHLVLLSRVDPPLPLNRWRAEGAMCELRLHDLSFTLQEANDFLSRTLATAPDATLVETLHRRTEGWPVGLRLAALALRRRASYAEFASEFDADDARYIADYLVDEVLEREPPHLQEFLVSTAILNRFSAGLSAAVLQIDETTAQQHIDTLERENLFLIVLSPSPLWVRYHHQFQDMLLSRLHTRYDEPTIATLHCRAATWLAANDQVGDALRHLVACSDYDAAATLIEARRIDTLNRLRFLELEGWLDQLPPATVNQRLELLLCLAWIRHDQVENEECLAIAQRVETLLDQQPMDLPEQTRRLYNAELTALRVSLGQPPARDEALNLIRQSWDGIRNDVSATHCSVLLSLAYASQRLGDLSLALEIVLSALDATIDWPIVSRCRLLHTAGFFHYCAGDLSRAELSFQQNLRLAEKHDLLVIAVISRHGLGAIADARNQLELAEQYHLEVIKYPYLTSGKDAVVDMYSLIRNYARRGQPERSRPLVERLGKDARAMGQSFFVEQVAALEALVDLTCGEHAKAMRWALSRSRTEMRNPADRIPVIRARILLAVNSRASLMEADELLDEITQVHQNNIAWYRLAEALALQALVRARLGNQESALDVLGRAVHVSVPNGNIEPFAEHGQAILPLLRELENRPEYVRQIELLMAALPEATVQDRSRDVGVELPEPLTERELDVLALLAGRLSNKEIAHTMVLSPHTVRNHLANIFGKLQVQNRGDAIERARSLGLLSEDDHRQYHA